MVRFPIPESIIVNVAKEIYVANVSWRDPFDIISDSEIKFGTVSVIVLEVDEEEEEEEEEESAAMAGEVGIEMTIKSPDDKVIRWPVEAMFSDDIIDAMMKLGVYTLCLEGNDIERVRVAVNILHSL